MAKSEKNGGDQHEKTATSESAPTGINLVPMVDDFTIRTQKFKANSHDVQDGAVSEGTHRLLRFDFTSYNAGTEDLVVGEPGTGPFTWEESVGHDHFHLVDFNHYQLLSWNGNPITDGRKQSFCLEDSLPIGDHASTTPQFTCDYQGISAGWGDLYDSQLPGQYIVIDSVPNGDYRLRVTTDYAGYVAETNETDNTMDVLLRINGNKVQVLGYDTFPLDV